MDGFELEKYIIGEKLGGIPNKKQRGDKGIDGWSQFMQYPIQVKHWNNPVGRPALDEFVAAVLRIGRKEGQILGWEFSKGCYEEAERLKNEQGININLTKTKDVLKHL
jgi:hypothetical protein